jgi:hypothetical protein
MVALDNIANTVMSRGVIGYVILGFGRSTYTKPV